VIAGIAGDLQKAIELQAGDPSVGADAQMAALLITGMDGEGGVVEAPRSGYLQYIQHETLVTIATEVDAVVYLRYRPGHFIIQGTEYATVWPPEAAGAVERELSRAHLTGPYRTLAQDVSFGIDQLVEICIRALSAAVNDTFTGMTCIDWIGDSLCKVTGRWQPTRVYRDASGAVRVIATEVTWERLVQRAFEKIRQAGRGMPAVLIRQLDALARIMERTTVAEDRQVLLDQAAMIERLRAGPTSESSLSVRRWPSLRPRAAGTWTWRVRSGVPPLEQVRPRCQQQDCPAAEHREALPRREHLIYPGMDLGEVAAGHSREPVVDVPAPVVTVQQTQQRSHH
jgi:Predicted membrane protein (DUF2254)